MTTAQYTILSWCPCDRCDPCCVKPPVNPSIGVPTTPGGWYGVVKQFNMTLYQVVASVNIGFDGSTSGNYVVTSQAVLYVALEKNIAYINTPGYAGVSLGQFATPELAEAAIVATLANAT